MIDKINLFIRELGSTKSIVNVIDEEISIPYEDIKNQNKNFYKSLYDLILIHCKEVNLKGAVLVSYRINTYYPSGFVKSLKGWEWDILMWVTPDFERVLHSEEDYRSYCLGIRVGTKVVAKFETVSFHQFIEDVKRNFNDAQFISDDALNSSYDALKLPRRATKGSAGYDFFAPFDITLEPNETVTFPTGIRCRMNNDVVLQLYPRSSLGFKYKMTLDNTVAIIDSDYYNSDNEGHIQAKFTNRGDKTIHIKKGEAYMQGVFTKYYLAVEDEVTQVRNGGIGSTNK